MISKADTLDVISFSVIIPLYNKEKSIVSTIESVLNQSYPNFELLIINDGSTDNSLKVVQSFNDSRIKIVNIPNRGVSGARNLGISLSRNQFIVFLDADDLWFSYCLEEFCSLIQEFRGAQVFCTNYNMTGKDLKGSDRRYMVKDYFYTSAYFMAKWSIPIMLIGCVAIRKDCLIEIGNFNPDLTHGEDLDLWHRVSTCCKIAKSERITTIYRTEAENRASLKGKKLKLSANRFSFKRGTAFSSSQRLFYGIQIIQELMNLRFDRSFLFLVENLLKHPGWIIRGIFFIIKVRYSKFQFNPL